MKLNLLEKDLSALELSNNIIEKLSSNNINNIKDLWNLKRKELKDLNLNDHEIKEIIIKLQLKGLDLNNRKY